MQISELLTPVYGAAWLPWAVQYFFLVGISATTALTAAAAASGAPGSAWARLLPVAVMVLAVSAIAAPVSLLADLHQPGRFWHFYAHFTPWSWMSLGAYLLPVYVMSALLFCALWWFGQRAALRAVAVLLGVSALSILLYTGSEVMVLRSRALWNTPFLPINFALTGWLGALGAMFLIGRWMPGGVAALPMALLRRLAVTGVVLMALSATTWALVGMSGFDASFDTAVRLFSEFPIWRLSLAGAVATGCLLVGLLQRPAHALAAPVVSAVLGVSLLACAWIFRWVVFMSVQGVPKYGAGLYLIEMPWGSDGLLGMLGVLGLCVALVAALTYLVERFAPRHLRVA